MKALVYAGIAALLFAAWYCWRGWVRMCGAVAFMLGDVEAQRNLRKLEDDAWR